MNKKIMFILALIIALFAIGSVSAGFFDFFLEQHTDLSFGFLIIHQSGRECYCYFLIYAGF